MNATKQQEQRIAKQLDRESIEQRYARLREEQRALKAEAEKAGISLRTERKLASGPENGQLLAIEYGEVEGHPDPVLVLTIALADRSKTSKDGREYIVNLSGSEVMDIPGLGEVTLGSIWMLDGKPASKGK